MDVGDSKQLRTEDPAGRPCGGAAFFLGYRAQCCARSRRAPGAIQHCTCLRRLPPCPCSVPSCSYSVPSCPYGVAPFPMSTNTEGHATGSHSGCGCVEGRSAQTSPSRQDVCKPSRRYQDGRHADVCEAIAAGYPRKGGGGGAEAAGRGCTSAPIPSGLQFPAGEAGRLRDEAFGQISHHELQIASAAVKAQNSSQRHAPKPECGSRVTLYSGFSSMQAGGRPFPRSGRAAGRRLTGPLEEEVAAERRARRRVVEGCRPDTQAVRRAACRAQVRWVCTSYRDPATTPQAA